MHAACAVLVIAFLTATALVGTATADPLIPTAAVPLCTQGKVVTFHYECQTTRTRERAPSSSYTANPTGQWYFHLRVPAEGASLAVVLKPLDPARTYGLTVTGRAHGSTALAYACDHPQAADHGDIDLYACDNAHASSTNTDWEVMVVDKGAYSTSIGFAIALDVTHH